MFPKQILKCCPTPKPNATLLKEYGATVAFISGGTVGDTGGSVGYFTP